MSLSLPFFLSPFHKSPWRLSYLLMMLRQRPSSFRISATSWRRAEFSRSRKAARTEIWFSLRRRASRERFAASLFLKRRLQYLSSFCSSGTSILRAFLIMGWGFSSSSEKRCRRGSNASWPGTLDKARSAGSGSKFTMTSDALVGGPAGGGGQDGLGEGSGGTVWAPCRHSGPPSSPGACGTSSPSSDDDEDEEDRDEMEEAEEEHGGEEEGGHWELWLGTADCVLREGTWAVVLQVFPDGMHPIPFSVKNSSRSMYWSWNRPPSHGNERSHSNGPRKVDWLVERMEPLPPFMTPTPPNESSSESKGLSLSFISQQSFALWSPLIGSWRRDFRLAMELFRWPLVVVPAGLEGPSCGLVPAGRSGGNSWEIDLDIPRWSTYSPESVKITFEITRQVSRL